MSNSIASIFLTSVIKRLWYYKELGDQTFAQLEEKDFYFKPDSGSNSIAIIIQHMSGNMISRWTNFLTEDGEKSWRSRDEEFNERSLTMQQLLEAWDRGWQVLLDTLKSLTEADLYSTIYIRHEPLTAMDAINRQLAHYPYHVGQIVYIGRMMKGPAWKSLSIAKGASENYNEMMHSKK